MISLLCTGILTISVSQREDYFFEKCRICPDFIDVLLKDGINEQSGERRLFKDIFACSFGLETFNLFVKPPDQLVEVLSRSISLLVPRR